MSNKSANVVARVEPEIKKQAEAILADLGVSTSTLINMLYRQIVIHEAIPFPITKVARPKALDEMTKEEFDAMMQEGLDQAKAGLGTPPDEVSNELLEGLEKEQTSASVAQ